MVQPTAKSVLHDYFWQAPETHRQRINKVQMKAILLENEPVIIRGNLWDIKHKHLGLGVYEIWLEQRTYGD